MRSVAVVGGMVLGAGFALVGTDLDALQRRARYALIRTLAGDTTVALNVWLKGTIFVEGQHGFFVNVVQES